MQNPVPFFLLSCLVVLALKDGSAGVGAEVGGGVLSLRGKLPLAWSLRKNDHPSILSLLAWQQPGGQRRQARAGLHPDLADSSSELMKPLVEVGVGGGVN